MPSKWERLKVQKFLKALKQGRMKTLDEKKKRERGEIERIRGESLGYLG